MKIFSVIFKNLVYIIAERINIIRIEYMSYEPKQILINYKG